jgi:hypothetical protein
MPNDLPRFESNERVDLTDLRYSVDSALQAMIRQANEEFLTNPNGATKSWIIDGFAMSDLGAGQLSVAKGRGLLAQREGSTIHYGALTTEGDATKTLDLSGYANNTYNTYIRFQFVDAETQSRMFWNPSGSTEFAQSIQTRRQANWSLRVELASPGAEWVQIGTVQIVGGVIGGAGIVDQRNLYFEGSVSGTYANTWGGGTDRNADRQQYGIKDLQTFTAAVRTLFEDLRPTGGRWWEKRGIEAGPAPGTTYEPGMKGTGNGLERAGVHGVGSVQGSTGVYGIGTVNRPGVDGQGHGTGSGVRGTGGSSNGSGVKGTGDGSGPGVEGIGDTTGPGVKGTAGSSDAHGVHGIGDGSGAGVFGYISGSGSGGRFENAGTGSPLNLVPKTADPTTGLTDGDVWITTGGVFKVRMNGTTYTVTVT